MEAGQVKIVDLPYHLPPDLVQIDQWHRVDELLQLVTLEVIQRPGYFADSARDIDAIDLSATQVRLHQSDQLSPSVANYIKENNLYVS